MTFQAKGLVIARRPDRLDDCLITLLTQHRGLLYARAKSAYKTHSKLKGHIEIGNEIDTRIDNKGQVKVMTQAVKIRQLLSTMPAIAMVQGAMMSWMARVPTDDKKGLYDLMVQSLLISKNATTKRQLDQAVCTSLYHITHYLGLDMHMQSCVMCLKKSSVRWYITYASGGVTCHACKTNDSVHISKATLKIQDNTPHVSLLPHIIAHLQWYGNLNMAQLKPWITKKYDIH